MSIHVSLIAFQTHPGREDDFMRAFAACGMLTRPRAIDGFISAELFRQVDDPAHFVVIGRWQTANAYAAWQEVAQREAPQDVLAALAATIRAIEPGRLLRE